jgi:hypothetical protein
MRVSEKSLELNVGAELLWLMRNGWGLTKAYLRGLTQKEEAAEGVDFFVQLNPATRLFAFQFKAPRGPAEGEPYRYRLETEQHDLLYQLAQSAPGSVFYVFPYYVTPAKLQVKVPFLLQDTWLLPIEQMPTLAVFGGQATKIVRCQGGVARVNPEYRLHNLADLERQPSAATGESGLRGLSPQVFADWYAHHRVVGRGQGKRRNPWLVRGLRIVLVPE